MSTISIGRHGIRLLVHAAAVWLFDGDKAIPFQFAEYGGGRAAMKAAIRCADERNLVHDEEHEADAAKGTP